MNRLLLVTAFGLSLFAFAGHAQTPPPAPKPKGDSPKTADRFLYGQGTYWLPHAWTLRRTMGVSKSFEAQVTEMLVNPNECNYYKASGEPREFLGAEMALLRTDNLKAVTEFAKNARQAVEPEPGQPGPQMLLTRGPEGKGWRGLIQGWGNLIMQRPGLEDVLLIRDGKMNVVCWAVVVSDINEGTWLNVRKEDLKGPVRDELTRKDPKCQFAAVRITADRRVYLYEDLLSLV